MTTLTARQLRCNANQFLLATKLCVRRGRARRSRGAE